MLTGKRTYVGFGFGAIQAGLFLYEAFLSGEFSRLVVAEIDPSIVGGLRAGGNRFRLNIAHRDRIETVLIGPVEVLNPGIEPERRRLIDALAEATEAGSAIPSVNGYGAGGEGSIQRVLAAGLRKKISGNGPACIVYAAENHNRAAEILQAGVEDALPPQSGGGLSRIACFVNTVIGKMSGLISNLKDMDELNLAPITSGLEKAFLVESFNRILISRVPAEGEMRFLRGIRTFVEKDDLLPFEEAKLYGHNATHALAGYIGAMLGIDWVSDLDRRPDIISFLTAAFVHESGAALIRKHRGIDPLFTREGYRRYAEDLLERMLNPFLRDRIERVIRDTPRKLGWDDRLIGTMRVALSQGIVPDRYAFGAAAALVHLDPSLFSGMVSTAAALKKIWKGAAGPEEEQREIAELIDRALVRLIEWRAMGFADPRGVFDKGSFHD